MIQLPQGKLALMSSLGDVKLVFSSNLLLLLRLQVLCLILHSESTAWWPAASHTDGACMQHHLQVDALQMGVQ